MTCMTCEHWRKPPPAQPDQRGFKQVLLGSCKLDGRTSSPSYYCARHELKATPKLDETRLGLTVQEVIWLRENRRDPTANRLVSFYNMVVHAPADAEARREFHRLLREWRRIRPVLESNSSAGNPAGTDESTHHATHPADPGRNPRVR